MIRRRRDLAQLEILLAETRYQRDHGWQGMRESRRLAVANLTRQVADAKKGVR